MAEPRCFPVCIIGAGSSGVAMAKALKEQGIAFDCFEIGSDIGGMWRYENDNGLSSAYRSLHIDTSRKNLGYPDFPIADHYPDFLSHARCSSTCRAMPTGSGSARISASTRVERSGRTGDGGWQGRDCRRRDAPLSRGDRRQRPPLGSALAGLSRKFDGSRLHSHDYRTAEPFRTSNVLVVGIGNSAVDIAVDVCRQARRTYLSTRRSAWIMPKYIMGIPVDRWSAFFGAQAAACRRR